MSLAAPRASCRRWSSTRTCRSRSSFIPPRRGCRRRRRTAGSAVLSLPGRPSSEAYREEDRQQHAARAAHAGAEDIADRRPGRSRIGQAADLSSRASTLRAPAATVEPVSPSPALASSRLSSPSREISRSQTALISGARRGVRAGCRALSHGGLRQRRARRARGEPWRRRRSRHADRPGAASAASRAASSRSSDSEKPFMLSAVISGAGPMISSTRAAERRAQHGVGDHAPSRAAARPRDC